MTAPTISDVARLAGVSDKTVVRVINASPLVNQDIHRKVAHAIEETGFDAVPQAPVPDSRNNALVVLAYDRAHRANMDDVQAGMLDALGNTPFTLCVHPADGVAKNLLNAFRDFLELHRPSGVLLMPPLSARDELAGLAWEFGCRCARLGSGSRGSSDSNWTTCAEREAVSQAVHWLAEQGHRRIGFVGGDENDGAARERELGYLDAMAELGLDRGPSLIANGDGGFASGYDSALLLLDISPAPSAIVASCDVMAAGAIRAAAQRNVAVPHALSVVGVGDTALSQQLSPALTTVQVPRFAMARAATMRLIEPVAGAAPQSAFPAPLVERQSTAPAQER